VSNFFHQGRKQGPLEETLRSSELPALNAFGKPLTSACHSWLHFHTPYISKLRVSEFLLFGAFLSVKSTISDSYVFTVPT